MKPASKFLLALLSNLLFAGWVQAQSEPAPAAPTWMGVDSFADAAYLRAPAQADGERGHLVLMPGPALSTDAQGSFRMLSRQDAVPMAMVSIEPLADSPGFEATASPVPELHAYALILAGLGVVGFMARRRSSGR